MGFANPAKSSSSSSTETVCSIRSIGSEGSSNQPMPSPKQISTDLDRPNYLIPKKYSSGKLDSLLCSQKFVQNLPPIYNNNKSDCAQSGPTTSTPKVQEACTSSDKNPLWTTTYNNITKFLNDGEPSSSTESVVPNESADFSGFSNNVENVPPLNLLTNILERYNRSRTFYVELQDTLAESQQHVERSNQIARDQLANLRRSSDISVPNARPTPLPRRSLLVRDNPEAEPQNPSQESDVSTRERRHNLRPRKKVNYKE